MPKVLTNCPSCGMPLKAVELHCDSCGLTLRNDFELSACAKPPSPFSTLNKEQADFLLEFLRCQGKLIGVQQKLSLSYSAAKRKLTEILQTLHLTPEDPNYFQEEVIMQHLSPLPNSHLASEIIKAKLRDCGGRAVIQSARGNAYELRALPDGQSFFCSALPIDYTYDLFNIIVDLLVEQGGKARKGNGRNYRVGDPECDETTVVGVFATRYMKKVRGDSTYDPVFALAAILEWAGIAHNGRGYLELTAQYREMLA